MTLVAKKHTWFLRVFLLNLIVVGIHISSVMAQCPPVVPGDVNLDGIVTQADARLALQHFLELITLDECQLQRANVADPMRNAITPNDTLCISRESLGQESCILPTAELPSRSSTIALSGDDRRVVVVNRGHDTVSVLEVRDAAGADTATLVAEVPVGRAPRAVALSPDDAEAYVSNSTSGTLSVLDLTATPPVVVAEIAVGSEPRGVAVTPNGTRVYVANHTAGTVAVVDPATRTVVTTLAVGGNPMALAISNDGDGDDTDETVVVTQFYAERIPDGPGEGFDTGKQGIVQVFAVADPTQVTRVTLGPLADAGFRADRTAFCAATAATPPHSELFCPPAGVDVTAVLQGAFPNQLQAALIRQQRLYVPSIGAGPEPPVRFNVNVQALVHTVDLATAQELPALTVNLNQQIAMETQPAEPTASLDRLFGNDLVALDATPDGTTVLLVSRGGNYVLRAGFDAEGRLDLGAPDAVVRFQTGNLPTGVVVSHDGQRAYTNNAVNFSVTALDLSTNMVLTRDIGVSTPPEPGTAAHQALVGELAFFTALGVPETGLLDTPIRAMVPRAHRGQASDNAWSSCGSCHPDGLADGVTWLFPTGPRQTVPLDAFFAPGQVANQRISNWNAVRGSITDFNNNARNVQGGTGFAADPAGVFNHGRTRGVSEALDAMTAWVATLEGVRMPPAADTEALLRGRDLFRDQCVTCHGGSQWTLSRVVYPNNPTFDSNPLAGGQVLDERITNAGPQIVAFEVGAQRLEFLRDVGTFRAVDPLEIRGAGAAIGQGALGGLGFNVPSLLGVRYHAPYLHHGGAQTLTEVFTQHGLNGSTIAGVVGQQGQADLRVYLGTLDVTTPPRAESATDLFEAGLERQLGAGLSGGQEVPPVETAGRGTVIATVNPAGTVVMLQVELANITGVTQAHLHVAPPGVNGPVILFVCTNLDNAPTETPACPPDGGTVEVTLAAADLVPGQPAVADFAAAVRAILTGAAYLNVHTDAHPAGEIRGQVGPVGFETTLDSAQEVADPPVVTDATGRGFVSINADQTQITFELTVTGIDDITAAHIHIGAVGVNGPIIFFLSGDPFASDVPLTGTLAADDLLPRPDNGIESFADAVNAIISGNTYINVHSTSFPTGEVRGQLRQP